MSDFAFNCPHCQQSLEASEDMLGMTLDCPACSGSIQLPAPENPTPPPTLKLSSQPLVTQSQVKECSMCGEQILAKAKKCKHCGSMLDGSNVEKPEQILADVAANLFRGIESVGGRLKITNKCLRFESNLINIQKIPAEIPLQDIAQARKRNTMGLVPNGMLVTTKSGTEYKFVVNGREKLIRLIEAHLPR